MKLLRNWKQNGLTEIDNIDGVIAQSITGKHQGWKVQEEIEQLKVFKYLGSLFMDRPLRKKAGEKVFDASWFCIELRREH